jgi:hypothetical protein
MQNMRKKAVVFRGTVQTVNRGRLRNSDLTIKYNRQQRQDQFIVVVLYHYMFRS